MKNALILHGTDFSNDKNQRHGNWFPWLKTELEKAGYQVWLPELPNAKQPDLKIYWNFLKDFEFNEETVIIGHSSGGAMVFGILHKLDYKIKINKAISVAGFYKNEGWGCEGLFSEEYDWEKIKKQAKDICLYWSPNDPYISKKQTDFMSSKLNVEPIVIKNQQHFSIGTVGDRYKKFPELLNLVLT
jgi:uncharacterized protein